VWCVGVVLVWGLGRSVWLPRCFCVCWGVLWGGCVLGGGWGGGFVLGVCVWGGVVGGCVSM